MFPTQARLFSHTPTPIRFAADSKGPDTPADKKPATDAKKPPQPSAWDKLGDLVPQWTLLAAGAQALAKQTVQRGLNIAGESTLGPDRMKRLNQLDLIAQKAKVEADQNLFQSLYKLAWEKYSRPTELLNMATVDTAIQQIEDDVKKKVDTKLGAGQFDRLKTELNPPKKG